MSKVPCKQKSQLVDPHATFTLRVIAGQNTCSSVSYTVKMFFCYFYTFMPIFWMSKVPCEQKSQKSNFGNKTCGPVP